MRAFILKLLAISVFIFWWSMQAQARLTEKSTRPTASVCAKDVCVTVEVVSQWEDMKRGLQGKEGLEDNHGMFFIFNTDDFHRFWMKDMKFTIDMIWIDHQHHIVTITPSCEPCVQEPCGVYAPSEKSRYVLEVSAGFALKHQLKKGDTLEFRGIN